MRRGLEHHEGHEEHEGKDMARNSMNLLPFSFLRVLRALRGE